MNATRFGLLAIALASIPACNKQNENAPTPASSAAAAASAATTNDADTKGAALGVPYPADKVLKVVNPKGEAPYAGPTGSLKGTVRITGDPPPDTGLAIPGNCNEAMATYGKLFRVGLDNALADALVAVTEYKGYVPSREPAAKMTIHGCALAKRTMAVTYGQRVEVSNIDKTASYMPYLDGSPMRAVMVAVPGGDSVKFYPQEPGHYMIRDQLPKPFLVADVFVLAYATHDVTGLDGQYEIKDIPVGKVRASAFLPVISKASDQIIEIKPGENRLDFTINFDKAKDVPSPQPAASSSASAPPTTSANAKPNP